MYNDPRYPRQGLSTGATVGIALFASVLAGAAAFFVCWTLIAKPTFERLEARVVAAERTRDARDMGLASKAGTPPSPARPMTAATNTATTSQPAGSNPVAPMQVPARVANPTPAPAVAVPIAPANRVQVAPSKAVPAPAVAVRRVAAPDVRRVSMLQAAKLLSTAELTLGAATEQHSEAPAGEVISQTPPAGSLTDAGTAIAVVVSKGPDGVEVPHVLKMDMERARRIVRKAGLKSRFVEQFHPSLPSGYVFRTRPAAPTRVAAGSLVKLYIVE